MKELLKEQEKAYHAIQEMYKSKHYTFENPLLVLNPYGVCPLSGLMVFHSECGGKFLLDIEGIQGKVDLRKDSYFFYRNRKTT